jgi:hypothetical protein
MKTLQIAFINERGRLVTVDHALHDKSLDIYFYGENRTQLDVSLDNQIVFSSTTKEVLKISINENT